MKSTFKPCAIVFAILMALAFIGSSKDEGDATTIVDKFNSYSFNKASNNAAKYREELIATDYTEFAVPVMKSIYSDAICNNFDNALQLSSTYLEVTSPNEYTDKFTKIMSTAKEGVDASARLNDLNAKYNNNIQAYYDYISQGNYYHTFYIGNLIEQTTDGRYIYTVSADPMGTEIYALRLAQPATGESNEYNVFPSGETMTLTSYNNSQSFDVNVLDEVSQEYIDGVLSDYEDYSRCNSIITDRRNIISGLLITEIP